MKSIKCLFGLLMLAGCLNGYSQDYETSLGLRLDVDNFGVTFKHFLKRESAFEGIVHFWDGGIALTALYEYHGKLIEDEQNLKWYGGGGGHLGVKDKRNNNELQLGIDGIVGLEYTFESVPLNFSIDIHPMIHLFENYDPDISMGLSGRYIFKY